MKWWSLDPFQHNEIIKPFVSFQLSKLSQLPAYKYLSEGLENLVGQNSFEVKKKGGEVKKFQTPKKGGGG